MRSWPGRSGTTGPWISRALSGQRIPPWELIERIATMCDAHEETARRLQAAVATRCRHLTRETEGCPPPDVDSYLELIRALRDLVDRRGISQRDLVRRDETGLLRHSTIGAVLRMRRSAGRDVTIGIVRACGVDDALGTRSHRWGGAW